MKGGQVDPEGRGDEGGGGQIESGIIMVSLNGLHKLSFAIL